MNPRKLSFTSIKGDGGGDFQGDGGVDLYDDVITAPSTNDAPPSTDNRQVEVCRTTYQLSIVLQKPFLGELMKNINLCKIDFGCNIVGKSLRNDVSIE